MLFGGGDAAGRLQPWDEEEDEEDENEEYGLGEGEGQEEGMYEMVPSSPQIEDDDDVCLLMGPAGVKLQRSAGAGKAAAAEAAAAAAAAAPVREATTGTVTAKDIETRVEINSLALQRRGNKTGVVVPRAKTKETKDEGDEREEVGAAGHEAHECVICLEEFTRENPEMHTLCSCGENRARFHYPCLLIYLERGPRGRREEQRRRRGEEEGEGGNEQYLCPTCRGPLYWEEMA
ncbi:Hypothetical protein NocV09_01601470 [Nannochloropsis oceanica]